MPEWLAYLIAVVILFIIEQFLAIQQRPARRMAARPAARPPLPRDSAQPTAASIRTQSADATARPRAHDGVAPSTLTLASALATLRDKLQGSEEGPAVWSQLEAMGIVPDPLGPDTVATQSAPVPSPLRAATNLRRTAPRSAPAGARHAEPPAFARHSFARAGTGPPTGPPSVPTYQSCYA
ncbi:MAG TPA: hypothetical protein VGG99_24295 [Acetobacteraceae bacterium]|jgi:hypothetical protein